MSSILSERYKHSSEQAAILLRKVAEEIEKEKQKNISLDTLDVRVKGRFSTSLIKYNDERFAFRKRVLLSKKDFIIQTEPDHHLMPLWYNMDHLGKEIIDISNNGNNGLLEGHPTLAAVPVDLGYDNLPEEPKSVAINFNTGQDSISALEGELIRTPDSPRLQLLTNDTLYPTYKKFSVCFRFLSTDWSADEDHGGLIFRRFGTKRDDTNNGFLIAFDDDGDIVFHVYQDATWYRRKIDNLTTNDIYEAVITYDEQAGATAADRIKMYYHKYTDSVPSTVTDQSVDDSASSFLLAPTNVLDHTIGARGDKDGYFRGWIQDYRIYAPDNTISSRNVLTAAQARNWFINKVSIDSIPFGSSFVAGVTNCSIGYYTVYDVSSLYDYNFSASLTRAAIKIDSNPSELKGSTPRRFTVPLKRTGDLSGNLNLRIRNSSDTILWTSASLDVSTIPTSFTSYIFTSYVQSHVMAEGDYISIEYTGSDASNYITYQYRPEQYTGAYLSQYSGSWNDLTGYDLTMKIEYAY